MNAALRLPRLVQLTFCGSVLAFLVLPILVVIPMSLNPGAFLVLPSGGLSLRWYEALLQSNEWMLALRNSLWVAGAVTLLATPLGTLAAIGVTRMRPRSGSLLLIVLCAPLVVPVVIVAIAFYFAFAPLGLVNGFTGLVIAHTLLAAPFVMLVVHASLKDFNMEVLRAAASLGATPLTVLLRVLVPLIAPALAAGAVFAFMTSFDETVVTLLIASPDQRTLPVMMFAGVREQISPMITAAATLLVIASSALLGAAELLRRRRAGARATM